MLQRFHPRRSNRERGSRYQVDNGGKKLQNQLDNMMRKAKSHNEQPSNQHGPSTPQFHPTLEGSKVQVYHPRECRMLRIKVGPQHPTRHLAVLSYRDFCCSRRIHHKLTHVAGTTTPGPGVDEWLLTRHEIGYVITLQPGQPT